ncbi:MAG: AAA family ATPase [Prevotellaceae bacterium]|nr:AAA family ATPase [Prevotellaceae bacterium]
MKERIKTLLGSLNSNIYEKDAELALSLLAAIAGESIILLGPPGVAKSMIGHKLKGAFENGKAFEYLMSRFSTPDEIFGPVSISKLKDNDRYERAIKGYLPDADVVFLDEIWKAGPAIQNTLLTVINEKIFRNGDQIVRLPLKLLIAASNELPAQGEGLEALWDRFLIRVECKSISRPDNFAKMLLDESDEYEELSEGQITAEEYEHWQRQIKMVTVNADVLKKINTIRNAMHYVTLSNGDEPRSVYVSDRRWKKIMRLMKTEAFLHDRTEVDIEDLMPIYHCLWQEPEERDGMRNIVIRAIFQDTINAISKLKEDLEQDIRQHRANRSVSAASMRGEHFDDSDKKIYGDFYFHVLGHDSGNTYIFMTDYMKLRSWATRGNAQQGVLIEDENRRGYKFIRAYSGDYNTARGYSVNLTRDKDHLLINGVRFEIEKLGRGEMNGSLVTKPTALKHDYFAEIESLTDRLRYWQNAVAEHLFVSEEDRNVVEQFLKGIYSDIANTRMDIGKLEI